MTKIQICILSAIETAREHLTAEQVLAITRREHPTASLSTVYRNLNLFAKSGKIRHIQRATGSDFFERNLTPHDHACCISCGRISDIKVPSLLDFLKGHFDYPILSFDLMVNYLCPECESKPVSTIQKGELQSGRQEKTD